MQINISGWAQFRKKELDPAALDYFRKTFTMKPRKSTDIPGPPPSPFPIFQETDNHIYVPRQYVLDRKQPHHEFSYRVSENAELWPYPLTFNGVLEPDQALCVKTIARMFLVEQRLGGILQAVPGYGKTVVSTAIINEIRLPTLVLVHKDFLVDQWIDRLTYFLPGIKIGTVKQDTCDYKDNHVTIALLQSIHARVYDPGFYEHFGLIVTDEVHRIGAPTWSQALPKFTAKYRLGLSATPRRSDGLAQVFFDHIGEVIYKGSIRRGDCRVRRVFSGMTLPESRFQNPGLVNSSLASKLLVADKRRNRLIIEQLKEAYKSGRKIMVMSHRKDTHLKPLKEALDASYEEGDTSAPITAYYVGGMKEADRNEAEKADIIFATAQMTREGLDIPALDTLFLVTPMGNVEQAVGRIQRKHADKKDPVIVDFRDDNIPICKKLARARWQFYADQGWVSLDNF